MLCSSNSPRRKCSFGRCNRLRGSNLDHFCTPNCACFCLAQADMLFTLLKRNVSKCVSAWMHGCRINLYLTELLYIKQTVNRAHLFRSLMTHQHYGYTSLKGPISQFFSPICVFAFVLLSL